MHAPRVDYIPCFSSSRAAGSTWQSRTRQVLLLVVLGLLPVGQATAQQAPDAMPGEQESAAASAPASPDRSGKVCRQEDVTGSRMKRRECRTAEQWEARERASTDMVRELDRKWAGGPKQD